MQPYEFSFLPVLALVMTAPIIVAAAQTSNVFSEGACTTDGVHIVFHDGTQKNFPAGKGYKCVSFKISADHRYAGWKFVGTLIAQSDGQEQTYPDATVYVLVGGKSYAVTENSRYINDWYFVPGRAEVAAETAFEHGPSTYVLYDLEKRKLTETCGQLELAQCPRLQKVIKTAR